MFIIGFVLGSLVVYLMSKATCRKVRKCNAHLRNENDYYFMLTKMMVRYADKHPIRQLAMLAEGEDLKKTYMENEKKINKTGRY